jgi:hypothetical protein
LSPCYIRADHAKDWYPSVKRLPNFFIVGAPKAGTTALHHHLGQHPEIFMSPLKETFYFADEMRLQHLALERRAGFQRQVEETRRYLDGPVLEDRFAGIVEDWSGYCRLFEGVREERAIGEATPMYLWSRTAPRRIAECVPDAKIIIILRDPADRAFYQYFPTVNSGNYRRSFQQHLEAALIHRNEEISILHPFLEYGLYAEQLERYRQSFPSAQIGVWLHEDTRQPDFLRQVFEFLGVDGGFEPDTTTRHLEQRVARIRGMNGWMRKSSVARALRQRIPAQARPFLRSMMFRPRGSVTMTCDERSLLIDFYREDILCLQTMLGRDLSAWLR